MSLIGEILKKSNILLDLDVCSKKRVFEQASELLEHENGLVKSEVFDCLFTREKLGSTALGHGVALPHGRLDSIKKPIGVFIRTSSVIPFDAPDGQSVSLFFIMLVPSDSTTQHLEILSNIASLLSNETTRLLLLKADNSQEIYTILTQEY